MTPTLADPDADIGGEIEIEGMEKYDVEMYPVTLVGILEELAAVPTDPAGRLFDATALEDGDAELDDV